MYDHKQRGGDRRDYHQSSYRGSRGPPNHRQSYGDRYTGPQGGSSQFTHKPKLEDDYRNKNIHKHKRNKGSNVLSPRTERHVQMKSRQFKNDYSYQQPSTGFPAMPNMMAANSFEFKQNQNEDQEMNSSRSYSRSKSRRSRGGSRDSRRSSYSKDSRGRRRSISREYDGYNANKQYGTSRYEKGKYHQERNYSSRGERNYSSRSAYQKRDDKYSSKHENRESSKQGYTSVKRQRQNTNDRESFSSYESFNQSKKRHDDHYGRRDNYRRTRDRDESPKQGLMDAAKRKDYYESDNKVKQEQKVERESPKEKAPSPVLKAVVNDFVPQAQEEPKSNLLAYFVNGRIGWKQAQQILNQNHIVRDSEYKIQEEMYKNLLNQDVNHYQNQVQKHFSAINLDMKSRLDDPKALLAEILQSKNDDTSDSCLSGTRNKNTGVDIQFDDIVLQPNKMWIPYQQTENDATLNQMRRNLEDCRLEIERNDGLKNNILQRLNF